MSPILIAALLVLAVLLAVWLWKERPGQIQRADSDGNERLDTLAAWPPRVTRILTTQERLAHGLLARAFPDHLVLAQVPLSRFLRVPTRYSHAEWLRRVGQMCADLVVCNTASQPLAVVIVQPPGGMTSERAKARHDRMVRVLAAAELRCQVWTENALPSLEAVRATLLDKPVETVSPAIAAAVVAAQPTPNSDPNAFDDTRRDSRHPLDQDPEGEEPPTTWYDEMASGPTPLQRQPQVQAPMTGGAAKQEIKAGS